MSHRDSCPDRWTAQREGERAQKNGYGRWRNPYDDPYSLTHCEEAADEWSRGYRRAEIREEEQREEDAARHRAEMRRVEQQAEEDYALNRQSEYEYYAMQQEQYSEEDLRAAEEAQNVDAVDPVEPEGRSRHD